MPMETVLAGIVSALVILGAERLFDYLRDKRKRKEMKSDKKEEKEEQESNEVANELKKLNNKVDNLEKNLERRIDEVQSNVDMVKHEAEEWRIVEMRIRILRFADELSHGEPKHSKDHFQQILEDCKCYEAYVDSHPDFKNGLTDPAIVLIREVYAKLFRKNDFI